MYEFNGKKSELSEARLEETESELSWEEANALRRVLSNKLDGLVSDGIFTTSEARAWVNGAEACGENAEWVRELLDYLGEYEYAGEAALEEIEELLKSPLWHSVEKSAWLTYATRASYQEKLSLIGRLTITLKQRKAEQEAVAKAKYKTIEDLVTMIQSAIGRGKLDEAGVLLGKLNPAEYQVSYVKLSKDLEKAKIKQVHETIEAVMPVV